MKMPDNLEQFNIIKELYVAIADLKRFVGERRKETPVPPKLSDDDKLKLIKQRSKRADEVAVKLKKAIEMNVMLTSGNGAKIEKILLFIVDNYLTGSFFGVFQFKIFGARVGEPKLTEQSFKIDTIYPD